MVRYASQMARYAFPMTRYAFQMACPIKDGKTSRMANPGRVIYRAGSLTLSIRLSQRAKYLTLKGLFSTRPFGPKCH